MNKLFLQLLISGAAGFVTSIHAAPSYDPQGVLAEFNERASITKGDAAIWATAINSLVGGYMVKQNSTFKLVGKGRGAVVVPPQVDLKDRAVYHQWIGGSEAVDAGLLNFFNFRQDKESLTELTITDVFSVTDGAASTDSCGKNRPATFSNTVRYYCISAITLSKISSKTFKKTKKLASGQYGIASSGGTFSTDNGTETTSYSASITPVGPFVNGLYVGGDTVEISSPPGVVATTPASVTARIIKKLSPAQNELKGLKLELPK